MLAALTTLLLFQLVGEVLTRSLALPVPGPVIGMVLLFVFLVLKEGPGKELQQTAQSLLQHLSLLFVPAGVGVMLHVQRVANEWLPIVASLIVSTFAGMTVTVLVLHVMTRQRGAKEPQ